MRLHRQAQQFVPKFQRRGVRLFLAEGRLVRRFPSLVVETYLVRTFGPLPPQFKRRVRSVVVKPCCLVRSVPVGALPNLAHPVAIDGHLPASPGGFCQSVRSPCLRFRRVFQHPTKPPHALKRRGKAAAVVPRSVVLSTPSGIVRVRHCAPQLAWRVRHNRQRPRVASRVSMLRPGVHAGQSRVASVRLHKQCGAAHNNAVKPTFIPLRFIHSAYLQR
jgi:hypothetical protein